MGIEYTARKSKIGERNHIVLHSFMVNELNLKGNELIIYACIYGFSQNAENQMFTGSLQYLADWTNSTKQGVMKALKNLIEKGFIKKNDKFINGVKFCEYYATEFNGVCNKVERGMQQSLTGGSKQSLPNNKELKTKENNINNNYIYNVVLDYLNKKANTNYRAGSKATQQHINARIAEGYTIDDFKTVIDKKCAEWLGTEFEQYLRPQTLFGTKFDSYLNSPIKQFSSSKPAYSEKRVTINGVDYVERNGKFYLPNGSGIAIDPYKKDDLPF